MATSSKQRNKKYWERIRKEEEAPRCGCDRLLNGAKSRHRGMCSYCFQKTETAKLLAWIGMRKLRGLELRFAYPKERDGWCVGMRVRSPHGEGRIDKITMASLEDVLVDIIWDNGVSDRLMPEDMGNIKPIVSSPTA